MAVVALDVGVRCAGNSPQLLQRIQSRSRGGLPGPNATNVDATQLASGREVPHDGDRHSDTLARIVDVGRFDSPGLEVRVPRATKCSLGVRLGHGEVRLSVHTCADAAFGVRRRGHRDGSGRRVEAGRRVDLRHLARSSGSCALPTRFRTR
jgi:hypothetical protein